MILAFDTSGPWVAVAMLDGGETRAYRHVDMAKGQAEHLMPLIEATLAEAGATLPALVAIGVGIGPGNFTGIRISVAAARGLALALGIPAIGVSTLQALALDARGPVLTSVDARQDKLYTQTFDDGAAGGPPRLAALADTVLPRRHGGMDVVGHRAGDLSQLTGGHAREPSCPLPVAIARITALRLGTPQPRPAPLYVRPADAAPSREAGPVIL